MIKLSLLTGRHGIGTVTKLLSCHRQRVEEILGLNTDDLNEFHAVSGDGGWSAPYIEA